MWECIRTYTKSNTNTHCNTDTHTKHIRENVCIERRNDCIKTMNEQLSFKFRNRIIIYFYFE